MTAHPLTDALVARHEAETAALLPSQTLRNVLRQVRELIDHAIRMEEDRAALAEVLSECSEAFHNRGEKTSLQVWNLRMRAADTKSRAALARLGERK